MNIAPECFGQDLSSGPGSLPRRGAYDVLPAQRSSIPVKLGRAFGGVWEYLRQGSGLRALQKRQRRLRVAETVSLGDKRFVSILEVDGQSFLVGGSGAGVVLLASLAPPPEKQPFERVLCDSYQQRAAR